LGVKPIYKVLNDHTRSLAPIVAAIEENETAVLVTDAGTPGISDPGADLVAACLAEDIEVHGLPGPSAVTLALSISGFFAQRFAFLGFPPRKAGDVKALLQPYAESTMTLVLYESPFRLGKFCTEASAVLGDRQVVICRELTKVHEQIWRGKLKAVESAGIPAKGEVTLVIEGHRRLPKDA
jgi:16S rRNA (cytidine1402-2'-O)-methyltransferase